MSELPQPSPEHAPTSPTRAQDGPQEPAGAPEAPVEPQDADTLADALGRMAVVRLTTYGPHDQRGAALWDAAEYIRDATTTPTPPATRPEDRP